MPALIFAQPLVLVLLVLAVPLVVWLPRQRLAAASRPMRAAIIGTRLGIVGLLVAALAAPELRPAGQARAVVFAIDTSDSVAPDQRLWAERWAAQATQALPPGSFARTIHFADSATVDGDPASTSTDLPAALRLASSLLPKDASLAPQVVLLSDGWSTAASSAPPTDALADGVAVSYVPLPPSSQRPLAVVHDLSVAPMVRVGDTADVSLSLQATQASDAHLRLWVGSSPVVDGQVHLEPGETHLSFPEPITTQGFVELRAMLQPSDGSTSLLGAMTVAKPAGHLLVLDDGAGQADALVALLQGQGLQIDRRPASSLPPNASGLSGYDGIVLVNTPATSITLDQQRTLQAYVQDLGRGLVVVGGPRSFSPGGYEGSVLDDLLPVSATPPVEPQQGTVALFLVIDRSGSMDEYAAASGGGPPATKMAMAREAAMRAAELLQPQDTLGVVAFDSSFRWVVPPTKLNGPADIQQAESLISTIQAGGGTRILPPLEAAYQAAAASDAPLKHIVLMTDGESGDVGYEDLIARMQAAHISLSTLAIGSDADTKLLNNLAHLGGGRYYFTERATLIPQIATKETNILTRNAIIEGQAAALVDEPSPILRSLSGDFPALHGYVATTPKDRAVTALETQQGHPLLAHWQYGLGRVVAWTSDAQQGWASDWASWAGAGQFWSQLVRWSLPAPVRADFQPAIHVAPDGQHVELSVQALADSQHFADLQPTSATIAAPDGTARQVSLPQRAPGRYALQTVVSQPGSYRVLFTQGDRTELGAFAVPDAAEAHSVGMNTALLEQLAAESGGRGLSDPTDLGPPARGLAPPIPLWPWLLGAALALLPLDVLLRRRV